MPIQLPYDQSFAQLFIDPAKPSAIVGSVFGVAGVAFGSVRGVASGRRPIVSALTVGGTWFGFASVYWYSRIIMLKSFVEEVPTSKEKLLYSTLAGGISGGVNAGMNRGLRYVWPMSIFSSGVCLIGQACYNAFEKTRNADADGDAARPLKERLMQSSWMPLKPISEERYEEILTEKLEETKSDIVAIDEKISATRALAAATVATTAHPPSTGEVTK